MATIHNTDLFKELQEGIKIQQLYDRIPAELAEKVVPVMEVNPKLLRKSTVLAVIEARTTTANQQTLLAAQPNKEVFITGLIVANVQDAVCDNTSVSVRSTFDSAVRNIYIRRKPATTVSNISDVIIFSNPLKIDRNSIIQYNLQFAAAGSTLDIILLGYYTENPNA